MTDNRVLVDENGKESVFVNRSDGYAVSKFKEIGYEQLIISTEENKVMMKRAEKLGIHCIQGVRDKKVALMSYAEERKLSLSQIMFVGNDLNVMPAFSVAGYCGCPADADEEIKKICVWISACNGGLA